LKSIRVNILGREFFLKSDADEEYINQVVDYVKQKIETVQKGQAMDIISAVILAALNIADDYFQLKKERESLIDKVEGRSFYLLNKIDSQLR
jgi:cell division protein ZapA